MIAVHELCCPDCGSYVGSYVQASTVLFALRCDARKMVDGKRLQCDHYVWFLTEGGLLVPAALEPCRRDPARPSLTLPPAGIDLQPIYNPTDPSQQARYYAVCEAFSS